MPVVLEARMLVHHATIEGVLLKASGSMSSCKSILGHMAVALKAPMHACALHHDTVGGVLSHKLAA